MANYGSTIVEIEGPEADVDALEALLASTRDPEEPALAFTLAGIAGDPRMHGMLCEAEADRAAPGRLLLHAVQKHDLDAGWAAEILAERFPSLTVFVRFRAECDMPAYRVALFREGRLVSSGATRAPVELWGRPGEDRGRPVCVVHLDEAKSREAFAHKDREGEPWLRQVVATLEPGEGGWRLNRDRRRFAAVRLGEDGGPGVLVALQPEIDEESHPDALFVVLDGLRVPGVYATRTEAGLEALRTLHPGIAAAFEEVGGSEPRTPRAAAPLPGRGGGVPPTDGPDGDDGIPG